MSDYGKKGGTSATRGRKATFYMVRLPDGSYVRKRSFGCSAEDALACVYEHQGFWYVASIFADAAAAQDAGCGHYRTVRALANR